MKKVTLERGLIIGAILALLGLLGSLYAVLTWGGASFGELVPSSMMRVAIPSVTALGAGIQLMFGVFFLSLLGLRYK
jgi:hypothetical protein